jgi:hypothetical protein
MEQALGSLAAPAEFISLNAGLRYLTSIAETQNETLFFVAEAELAFGYKGAVPNEIISPSFLAEALRLRSAVVVAHRNPLDVMLCTVFNISLFLS